MVIFFALCKSQITICAPKSSIMKFNELSALPFVHLYAGDLPDMPQYRATRKIGLSLTQENQWHIRHNITNPMPLAEGSVDIYQSEDVFEHIEYAKLPAIVHEIYRVLKKGGLFRLSLPDYRCDLLYERTLRDKNGNILYDPFGGGNYRRKFYLFGPKVVVDGGHLWFPTYEFVKELLQAANFSSVNFLHYFDENKIPHTNRIDYEKGFIQRTPDNDTRVSSPYRPMSIVVDCNK